MKIKDLKSNEKKIIYSKLNLNAIGENTPVYGAYISKTKFSENSFQLINPELYINWLDSKKNDYYLIKIGKKLGNIFGIKEANDKNSMFIQKFKQATLGEATELKRISYINSSSLCALLCFYNISKEKPLKININGKKIKFTSSVFEWQNIVTEDKEHPSSVDVVLIGKSGNKKIILFLESKFSEYLFTGSYHPSLKYIDKNFDFNELYSKESFKKIDLKLDTNEYISISKTGKRKCTGTFTIGEGNNQYAAGVKQMISHYIGICKRYDNKIINVDNGDEKNKFVKIKNIRKADVYLGTIIFKFNDSYDDLYNKTALALNEDLKNNRKDIRNFKVIEKVLTYQNIFRENKNALGTAIKAFYNL